MKYILLFYTLVIFFYNTQYDYVEKKKYMTCFPSVSENDEVDIFYNSPSRIEGGKRNHRILDGLLRKGRKRKRRRNKRTRRNRTQARKNKNKRKKKKKKKNN
ncbi:hypothetical protein PFAG_00046 [Plasmodium falciparum Santa Lucia]|uniref:Uncharacterized protein n=1 Tax=Plasmodium falciparum Santa Lucia TaxID=478859 RepID=W7G5P3_PLAFA|nr:hypothetical protein PFAG_00046 [Plasmodium falciparum Santa Lucia]